MPTILNDDGRENGRKTGSNICLQRSSLHQKRDGSGALELKKKEKHLALINRQRKNKKLILCISSSSIVIHQWNDAKNRRSISVILYEKKASGKRRQAASFSKINKDEGVEGDGT